MGICVERSVEMVVGVVGVLKAGGAYVPLDPGYPAERLRYMIEDSAPVVLLTQGHLEKWWAGMGDSVRVLDLGSASPPWREHAESSPARDGIGADPQHLAYVIYTSGSTGTPKGVMVTHRNVVGLVRNTSYVDFAPLLTIGHLSNPAFDAATFEVWGALLNGCRLAVIPRFDVLEPEKLAMQLQNLQVSTLFLTTALFNECIRIQPDMFHGMEQILFGGERCDPQSIRQGLKKSPQRGLFHVYGPTGNHHLCDLLCHRERGGERDSSDWSAAGEHADLHTGWARGAGGGGGGGRDIYRGEWGGAGLLEAAGADGGEVSGGDPFREDGKGRMYRTGDLGRWLADGNIVLVGGTVFQVMGWGYRIELGEIEARLREREGVGEAVVVAREDRVGEKRLVAYYTRAAAVGAEQLREHLAASLPEYMVPAAYVGMERMPLTANGKLDRKALPAPEGDAYVVREYEEPEGEMEESLAGIWAEVLHVERVGRQDNFFELGGHSLLAVRVIARVREALKVEVGIRDLFAHSVLSDLAGVLENAAPTELSPIVAVERGVGLPLSFAQQRLWFLAQMEGVSEAYHMPMGWGLKGGLDRAALRKALDRIVARHEALRTRFALVEGEPVQRIEAREESRFHLVEHDLRGRSDAVEELARLGAEEAEASFDLEAGPLIRGRLVRLGEEEDALLITMHHIVSDGWSMGVFRKELSRLYGAFLRGEADPLAELEIQYADYAVWQRNWIEGEMLQEQAAYWKKALAGGPVLLELPADHPRPAQQDFAGGLVKLALDERLTAGLKDVGRRHGVTLNMALLAAWGVLLSRLSGQGDVVIGTPTANRRRLEVEGLIGFFVNTLAVRLELSGSPTVSELLGQAREQVLAAQQHEDIPFEQVVDLLNPVRSLSHSPLFQVMFGWQNNEGGGLELEGIGVVALPAPPHRVARFDLTVSLRESGGGIAGVVEHATSLFEGATIERYLGYFRNLLEAMVADDTQGRQPARHATGVGA